MKTLYSIGTIFIMVTCALFPERIDIKSVFWAIMWFINVYIGLKDN